MALRTGGPMLPPHLVALLPVRYLAVTPGTLCQQRPAVGDEEAAPGELPGGHGGICGPRHKGAQTNQLNVHELRGDCGQCSNRINGRGEEATNGVLLLYPANGSLWRPFNLLNTNLLPARKDSSTASMDNDFLEEKTKGKYIFRLSLKSQTLKFNQIQSN